MRECSLPSLHLNLPELEFESEHFGEDAGKGGKDDDSGDVVEERVGRDAGDLEGRVQLLEQLGRQFEHVVGQTKLLFLEGLLLHLNEWMNG